MDKIFNTIHSCRLCDSKHIIEMLNLTDQPPANSLYKSNNEKPQDVPLRLMFCKDCSAVQLGESVDPAYLFNQYVWVTGTSSTAIAYSIDFANNAISRCQSENPKVVEIASNDGTFLKRFLDLGCEVLGVDPAKNIAQIATDNNIPTIAKFFTTEVASEIVEESGHKDIVIARNVLPHVKEIHSVVKGISALLKEDTGLGVIEFHDAGLIWKELHYDSIYHEHLFLFSLKTMSQFLKEHGLHVFDIMPSPISGGSWVIYFSKIEKPKSKKLLSVENDEKDSGLNTAAAWDDFSKKSIAHAEKLKELIFAEEGKILAYGASARSSTLLNFCGIDSQKISAIIDKNPLKHDLFTPGSDIPVISYEEGLKRIVDTKKILLLAWNFQDEIVRDLRESGFEGEFIVPLPNEPHIV